MAEQQTMSYESANMKNYAGFKFDLPPRTSHRSQYPLQRLHLGAALPPSVRKGSAFPVIK